MPVQAEKNNQKPLSSWLRTAGRSTILIGFAVLTGCAHVDVTRIAYEALRKEDCRINELEDFCTRTFAHEYKEYTRQRKDFIRGEKAEENDEAWQVSLEDQAVTKEVVIR